MPDAGRKWNAAGRRAERMAIFRGLVCASTFPEPGKERTMRDSPETSRSMKNLRRDATMRQEAAPP